MSDSVFFKRLTICYGVQTVNISELLKWFADCCQVSVRIDDRSKSFTHEVFPSNDTCAVLMGDSKSTFIIYVCVREVKDKK